MKITAYTYDAALHCIRCTSYRFNATAQGWHNADENNVRRDARDREGNPVTPAFGESGYCDACGMAYGNAEPVARLLSIEAWRDGSGWTWNNWYKRGMVPVSWCDLKPRALLRRLRDMAMTLPAPGCAAIDDDGHNLVIIMRGTREPIAAIEYGSVPA